MATGNGAITGEKSVNAFIDFLEGLTVPLVLSLFGGIAKTLRDGFRSWSSFAASLFVSGFAGVIVHLFIQDLDCSGSVKAGLVGLSGYSSGMILDALTARFRRGIERIPGPGTVWNGIERRKDDGE